MPMIFVAGLGRSGTTLLHFMVGAHPRCIALGEVWKLIRSTTGLETAAFHRCSCGAVVQDCEFWGPLVPRLQGDGDYRPVLEHVRRCYGERIPVDSSKSPAALQEGARVLYCIRDVRAWTHSVNNAGFAGFRRWYRQNRSAMQKLEARGDWLPVSYDELVLDPVPSTQRVCAFLGLDYDPSMITDFGADGHHAVHCNRMKGDPGKMGGVRYDNRWFGSRAWLLPSLLMPRVMAYNDATVYGLVESPFTRQGARDVTSGPR